MSVFALPLRPARGHVPVRLGDGGVAHLRPLEPGEAGPLEAVFSGLSTASRVSRYFAGMDRLPTAMRGPLLDVDGHRHVAWLATVHDDPAGIARYIRVAPDTAEIAFEVVDAHHRRGIATALLDAVTTVAAARGVRRVQATLLASNTASRRLLTYLGVPLVQSGDLLEGETGLRLLDPARIDRRAVVDLATRDPRRAGTDGSCATEAGWAH